MRNELSSYLENISLLILGIFLLTYPLIFSTLTTDIFTLPKQIVLGAVVLLSIVFFGAKTISEGAIRFRRTPFDLPIFIFTLAVFASAIFSQNRYDALISFGPLLLAILGYYVIVNLVREKSAVIFLSSTLIGGATILAILTILSIFNVFPLPFAFAKNQNFTPLGLLLDQAIYLAFLLPIVLVPIIQKIKNIKSLKEIEGKIIILTTISLIIVIGFSVSVYQLIFVQKPLILPFETGFQTSFASISQDQGRVTQSFLLGSGFGTYNTDFTRFKQPVFNLSPFWSFNFFRSSNFVLELLATTGILGLSTFLFLIFRVLREFKAIKEIGGIGFSLALAFIISFIFPFTFFLQTTLILILGIFAAFASLKNPHEFFDIEYKFLAFKKGIISTPSKILPALFSLLLILLVALISYFGWKFAASDIIFQRSLVSASKNQGFQSYNEQIQAIKLFPYRDGYLRIYSQTNLALANNLAAQQPKGASPSAQVSQAITGFIQQSINSARNATAIAPLTSANWQNLSSIYRSLIGFGENASKFSIAANQMAISLDQNNPNQYLNLGGIYYRLGMWDEAIGQFQVAVKLKPDFANAYYNLGHALESKEDLQNALIQYETVKTLVSNNKDAMEKISGEIEALKAKIGTVSQKSEAEPIQKISDNQPPLNLSTPSAELPERKPPVKLP